MLLNRPSHVGITTYSHPLGNFFSGGTTGIVLDISRIETLWQDAAGTIPVTAAGQTVGRVDCALGSGRYFSAPNTGVKPEYKVVSGKKFLSFVGDRLHSQNGSLEFPIPTTFVGFKGVGNGGVVVEWPHATTSIPPYSRMLISTSAGSQTGNRWNGNYTATTAGMGWFSAPTNVGASSKSGKLYKNGVHVDSKTISTPITYPNSPLPTTIGGDLLGNYSLTMDFYGMIVFNREETPSDVSLINSWMQSLF